MKALIEGYILNWMDNAQVKSSSHCQQQLQQTYYVRFQWNVFETISRSVNDHEPFRLTNSLSNSVFRNTVSLNRQSLLHDMAELSKSSHRQSPISVHWDLRSFARHKWSPSPALLHIEADFFDLKYEALLCGIRAIMDQVTTLFTCTQPAQRKCPSNTMR